MPETRPLLVAACVLLAGNLALELRPAEREHVAPHVQVCIQSIPEAPPAPIAATIRLPAGFHDQEPWPRGMVIAPPATGDRMPVLGIAPDTWLSALLEPLLDLVRPSGAIAL